ncbi:FAD binding domain-containing protein [Nonomuraea solani]|uniref:FAD binding domain-containing protein n=1 Tax=Nonomuraea solani TaxID=1144553 RepID=A0A1H6EZC9_9ACTN|nr:FAD-dependent monooxygenase [Nonomuraea solani]SEH03258.1 FAD binding domain-containing protein [Nonomuraea solani]
MREADTAATFAVRLRSAQPLTPWRGDTVTLPGDAAHAMSPGRGEGANATLRDARSLGRVVTGCVRQGTPLAIAKGAYEAETPAYGNEMVERSRRQPLFDRGSR